MPHMQLNQGLCNYAEIFVTEPKSSDTLAHCVLHQIKMTLSKEIIFKKPADTLLYFPLLQMTEHTNLPVSFKSLSCIPQFHVTDHRHTGTDSQKQKKKVMFYQRVRGTLAAYKQEKDREKLSQPSPRPNNEEEKRGRGGVLTHSSSSSE